MLTAKPIRVFSLAGKRVLTCHVLGENPHVFIGKDLCLYTTKGALKRIHIEGLSTASDIRSNEYDFHYTGDEVLPSDISDQAIIAEGPCEETTPGKVWQAR